jgi:hypothetical protein
LPARLLKVNFQGGKDYPCEQLQAALVFASDDFARGKQRGVVKLPLQQPIARSEPIDTPND